MKPFTTLAVICCFFCRLSLVGAEPAEYLRYFDPAKGFRPAQVNLTNVFLQAAGSLECNGSPEPYLRHMQAEHVRVATKYKDKTGRELLGHWPSYMTDEYLDQVIANWNFLAPKLHLESLAKDAGRCTREAIRGTRNGGTILVGIFNHHQDLVIDAMQGGKQGEGFEHLKATLTTELELNKDRVSLRGYEVARMDAVSYAVIFRGILDELYAKLDASLPPEKAAKLKGAVSSVFIDLGRVAHAELEIGMVEAALQ